MLYGYVIPISKPIEYLSSFECYIYLLVKVYNF